MEPDYPNDPWLRLDRDYRKLRVREKNGKKAAVVILVLLVVAYLLLI